MRTLLLYLFRNGIGHGARSVVQFPFTPYYTAVMIHAFDLIMNVVTYHMNAISYIDSQKWVTGSSDNVLWVKITEEMSIYKGK